MPERPDLRAIARDIRESLADYDREALVEILTYVFKEYVVQGAPPVLLGRADTIEDLAGLSFPELMRALQTRLEHQELELFQVQDEVVLVRAQGVLTPLTADQLPQRGRPAPVAAAPVADTGASTPRESAAEAMTRGRGDLLGGAPGVVQAPAPRPAPTAHRGLAISGRPTGAAASAEPAPTRSTPAPAPAAPAPAAPAQPAAVSTAPPGSKAEPDSKPAEGDDPASIRFSLLELD